MPVTRRRLSWPPSDIDEHGARHEWLVTNGLGGYASGTIGGAITRRYHGLLVAAQPAPLGRVMLLNHLSERIRTPDRSVEWLSVYREGDRPAQVEGAASLSEFWLEGCVPVWRHRVAGLTIERRVLMPYAQNTVHVTYRLIDGPEGVRLTLRPSLDFRPHDAPVNTNSHQPYTLTAQNRRIEISGDPAFPVLRLAIHASAGSFTVDDAAMHGVRYVVEASRGYDADGSLWSPGYFRADLTSADPVTLTASCEPWETIEAVDPAAVFEGENERVERLIDMAIPGARHGLAAELVLAADQFVVSPAARAADQARAAAHGRQARTIIAGYHWFTDWGRDTMISLEGLVLVTGRHAEARQILETFAQHERHGLIPNLFPEGDSTGLYHTADATLWFFHALDRYEVYTHDRTLVDELLPRLVHIINCHLEGTEFGIHAAPDGLLSQGAGGYQLTWMDAKLDDWVVTPRRGKAVEINALWYNALRLLEGWLRRAGHTSEEERIRTAAERAATAFNHRFWSEAHGHLFDVVDGPSGDDPACRPNQVLAVGLPHPVLARDRWKPVLDVVAHRLLTPVGLRSLAPGEPNYQARYFGDLKARDAAYHQGTVWAWLLGPFADAWRACYPTDEAGISRLFEAFDRHLSQACVGSISEIFDAEPPFTPRGCVAQAWSVAEVLRSLTRTR